jgi:hypothetical protein
VAAHGALQILCAAYAAAYRQILAINHQLEAYTGTPDTIFEHPKEGAAHLELIQQERCARGQARQRAKKLEMIKGCPFSADPINLYQGRIDLL